MEFSDYEKDIYVLKAKAKGLFILYSPLRGIAMYINDVVAYTLREYIQRNTPILETEIGVLLKQITQLDTAIVPSTREIDCEDKAVFLLSHTCNLACAYCYANNSRAKTILSFEKIKSTIDYIFSRNNNKKRFSFLGGGEPTLTWDLFVRSIDYIKECALKYNIPASVGVTTNGTLLDEERVRYLAENNVRVSVSFDILPDIQNRQRQFANLKTSSFSSVDKCIQLLIQNHISFKIRSTITQANVKRMLEMVKFVFDRYPEVKEIHFEPVCDISENNEEYYSQFITSFMEAYKYGKERNLIIRNSITNAFFHIRQHYCIGELCITPDGDIVACHRHATNNDIAFQSFRYGHVDENGVHIDKNALNEVIRYRIARYESCATCFATWNCAGGCTSIKSILTPHQQNEYCYFIKSLLKSLLEFKLDHLNR